MHTFNIFCLNDLLLLLEQLLVTSVTFHCQKSTKAAAVLNQQSSVPWLLARKPHKLTHQAQLQAVQLVLVIGNSRLRWFPSRLSSHSTVWDKGSTKHVLLSGEVFPTQSIWVQNVRVGAHVSTTAAPPRAEGTGQWNRERDPSLSCLGISYPWWKQNQTKPIIS